MIKTEYEAWTAIADTLEMIGGMPPWSDDIPSTKLGLCDVVKLMKNDCIIDASLSDSMDGRIYREQMRRGIINHHAFFFPQGLHIPRIKLARRFAEESL